MIIFVCIGIAMGIMVFGIKKMRNRKIHKNEDKNGFVIKSRVEPQLTKIEM